MQMNDTIHQPMLIATKGPPYTLYIKTKLTVLIQVLEILTKGMMIRWHINIINRIPLTDERVPFVSGNINS